MNDRYGMVARLAWRNLRAHPGQAVLLLLVLSVSATTVGLGPAVSGTGDQAWDRLHNSINGFDVQATADYYPKVQRRLAELPPPDQAKVARADATLAALAAEPGVVAVGGPWPQLHTDGRVGDVPVRIRIQVRDAKPAAVGQPLVTSGSWLTDDDGVVLEESFASLFKVKPGDEVIIAGQRLRVRGSATTTSVLRYPMGNPAMVWANRATAAKFRAAGAVPFGAVLELRLARAGQANALVAADNDGGLVTLKTREQARSEAGENLGIFLVLAIIATLLAGLTVATAAILVTGRMAARSRQIGMLKAVGVTPRQALGVVLVEYLAVAVTAAVIGIAGATLLSPLVVVQGMISLYGAPAAPAITWPRAIAALAVALAVVVVGSVQPALRGVRHSTVRALAAGARAPRRTGSAARLAGWAGLAPPVVMGLRSMMRRPGRTIANATGLALGVAMVIVGLGAGQAAHGFLDSPPRDEEEVVSRTVNATVVDQMLNIVLAAAVLLIVLATLNALIVAIFAARDSARNHAVLRSVGATPRQTVISFVVAQSGASLLGCAVGIPLGMVLYNIAAASGPKEIPAIALSPSVYVLVGVAALLLYLLAVIVPAARLARRPVTRVLTFE